MMTKLHHDHDSDVDVDVDVDFDLESNVTHASASKGKSWGTVLSLAFRSLGVVYGDIGTSPLYVYSTALLDGVKFEEDIVGILSLIYYTITLLPLVKYILIVLRATHNGKGGAFALYSLLCRHANIGLLPTQGQNEGRSNRGEIGCLQSSIAKHLLLIITMLSTSLVIGDGILTPSISVLSAVSGLKAASPSIFTQGRVMYISVAILILLFSIQKYGTNKVGSCFAPIVTVWLLMNAGIGVFNFIKYDPTVIKALNPWCIIKYFKRNGKRAWISLGGVVLCVTGTEALFADVGHFSVRSIQISMSAVVYPALLITYSGQASYLREHQEHIADAFYRAIPAPMYWPVFVIAVLAAIIASQAMISGTFSIVQQSLCEGCFPAVTVIHTSKSHSGQVYIPEMNYLIMIACVLVTVGFQTTEKIGNAYGIAVVFAETITSTFIVLVMLEVWRKNKVLVLLYVCCIMTVEVTYLTAVMYKFPHGGYFPLTFAFVLLTIMYLWNHTFRKIYRYELENKVSAETLSKVMSQEKWSRIPGMAIFHSDVIHGVVSPVFHHYLKNVPALQAVVVFASVKSLPITTVSPQERFLFRRVRPVEMYIFHCVVRYGYMDERKEAEPFEQILVEKLKEFLRDEYNAKENQVETVTQTEVESTEAEGDIQCCDNEEETNQVEIVGEVEAAGEIESCDSEEETNHVEIGEEARRKELEAEIEVIERARKEGIVHMIGEVEVRAGEGAGVGKRIVINYAYSFMKRNLRRESDKAKAVDIPRKRLVKVGMTYEL